MKKPGSSSNFLKPLVRGIPIIIAVMALFLFIASRYLKYSTPMYESTVKIKLADAKDGIPNSNLYKDFDVFATSNKIGTEIELLKSRVLVEKVVNRLALNPTIYRVGEIHKEELYNESPFIIGFKDLSKKYMDKSMTMHVSKSGNISLTLPGNKVVKGAIGSPINTGQGQLLIAYNTDLIKSKPNLQIEDNYQVVFHSITRLAESIAGELDVTSVDKDIPILRISYKSAVPKKSADIVNTLAAVYITDYVDEKYKSADTTEGFLASQLKEYGNKLTSSENAIRNYRDGNNIVNLHQETETDLRKIADLKKQLASVNMELEAIDTLNKYITSGKQNFTELAPNFAAFTDLLSTEMVKDIKTLQGEKKELLLKYTPQHEKVQVVDRKIEDLSEYLVESIRNTQTNLRIKRNNLYQTINESEQVFNTLPDKEKNMTILERNFGMNEQIYRFLQSKETEASIAKTATISFHRIISPGETPTEPVSPVKKLILVFSGFLGLIFSIIGIYVVHGAKARVDNEQIISRNSDLPIEFSVPFAKTVKDRLMTFNKWALELDLKKQLKSGDTICVTSNQAGEGKGFIAAGLADSIASLGRKTLLVLMDGMADGAKNSSYDVTSPFAVSADWKIPAVWNNMLENWKSTYDTIIIKNSSTYQENATIIAMCTAGINLYVVDSRITRIKDLQDVEELKDRLGLSNVSFVLNRAGYIPSLLVSIRKRINDLRRAK